MTETLTHSSSILDKELIMKDIQIANLLKKVNKLQDVVFFQVATEHEHEALRDLVAWLSCTENNSGKTNLEIIKSNILLKKYHDPNFSGQNKHPIRPHLQEEIKSKNISDFRVWIAMYSHRPADEPWKNGDKATDLEYEYLYSWFDENINSLYTFMVKNKYCRINHLDSQKKRYEDLYLLLKKEINEGKIAPLRYERNQTFFDY